MGKRKKIPECDCAACKRFHLDGVQMYLDLERAEGRSAPDTKFLRTMKEAFWPEGICGVCERDYGWIHCIPFVPQVVKDFFRIEYLCYGCRSRIRELQRQHEWFICWGVTPDDEIKWLLLHLQLETFNKAVRALAPAQIEKDKAFKEWLDSLPVENVQPVELKIKVRRRTPEASA